MKSRFEPEDEFEDKYGPGSSFWNGWKELYQAQNTLLVGNYEALQRLEDNIQRYVERIKGKKVYAESLKTRTNIYDGAVLRTATGFVEDILIDDPKKIVIPLYEGKVILKDFEHAPVVNRQDYHFVLDKKGRKMRLTEEEYRKRDNWEYNNGILVLSDSIKFNSTGYIPSEHTSINIPLDELIDLQFLNK